ncbi:MAG: cob(I)yrinic acid a,c-diamide adenosyltransferase [Ruminococcus sp.]|nr:cob(I)yrinic acid a,c-diamide adenosyltransferase [Ruminococcus sp.]
MIHIYSGDGKGKTTAAVGMAVRAAGAGLRVLFCQFLKDGSSSEIGVLRSIPGIEVRCCTECRKFVFRMNDDERAAVTASHNAMLCGVRDIISSHAADVVILDEFCGAYSTGLIDRTAAESIVRECPESVELVLTGRDPAPVFCGIADYHSEITPIKHPYSKGVKARRGIEY